MICVRRRFKHHKKRLNLQSIRTRVRVGERGYRSALPVSTGKTSWSRRYSQCTDRKNTRDLWPLPPRCVHHWRMRFYPHQPVRCWRAWRHRLLLLWKEWRHFRTESIRQLWNINTPAIKVKSSRCYCRLKLAFKWLALASKSSFKRQTEQQW